MSEFGPLREAVDDLASRAPSPAIDELRRRATRRGRRRLAVVAAAATATIVVGGSVAWNLGDSSRVAPVVEPSTPSPAPPTVPESAQASPASFVAFNEAFDDVFTQVPDWAISRSFPADYEYVFFPSSSNGNGRCSGGLEGWGAGSTGAGDGGIGPAGFGTVGFRSEVRASQAAARLVENLDSCTATAWRTQPIAGTDAVLASYDDAVAWIQQTGLHVDVLQVSTTDGPPPVDVQVEVATLMTAFRTWNDQDGSVEP